MNKLHEKIKNAHYGKILKWWLILGIIAALVGGGLSAILLRPQIQEVVSAVRTAEQGEEQSKDGKTEEGKTEEMQLDEKQNRKEERHFLKKLSVSEPSRAAKAVVAVTGVAALGFGAFYWLLIAAWLYSAAEHARMHGALWGLLGLGGNLFAAALFLVVRSLLRSRCPDCGVWQKHAAYCRDCGAEMEATCKNCGAKCEKQDSFCPVCGGKLDE